MKRHPLLLALLGITSGILLAGFIVFSIEFAFASLLVCAAILLLLIFFSRTRNLAFYFLLFAFLGIALSGWQDERFKKDHYSRLTNKEFLFSARLTNPPSFTKKSLRFELEMLNLQNETPIPIHGKILLYTVPDSALAKLLPGDILLFEGKLNLISPPQNPYEFDYKNYLNLHQIYAQCYSTRVKSVPQNGFSIGRTMAKTRAQLFGYIRAMHLKPEEESVAAALLLGYRHLLSDETQQAFSGAGAMHVLAVSGLHVGILYIITSMLLGIDRKKPQRSNWKKVVLAISIVWLYATLTGLSPSVTRAAVMFTFIAAGNLAKRKPAIIQMIIGSAIFLLAYNPNYLFDVGFQLSYSAVFGIVYLQSGFYNLLPKLRFWLVDQIWKITTVSIAAQAATFPLSVYYFHQFPLFFIVSNLIVIPLAWLLMYFGIFMLAVSVFMVPPAWLIWIFQSLLGLMTQSVHLVENLPHAVLQGLHWSRFDLVLITLLVYLFADAFWKKKKWALISSVAIAAFLSLKFSAEAIQNTAKQEITFYSIPKKTAIEIRLGTDAILLADSMLLQDKDAMLFFIRHNLWAGSISNTLEFELEKASSSAYHRYKNGVLDVFSHRILLYSEPIDSLKFNLNPTHIFVTRNIIPPKYLPHNCMVILQKGVNQKTVQVWKSKTENVYALAEEGALILQK